MKMLKRTLAMFMVLCMMFSIVPMTVFADDTAGTADVQTTAVDNDFQRILHLDCGRKYYTVDWIKALITEMKAAGFTHLQLAFGNDGLRFLLDDMTVGSYSDADVTAAVQNGNIAYNAKKSYTTELNELTQSEMDEIIAHANTTGIEIIPLFNNPGHMYTMITAMTSLGMTPGYNGSASTIDLDDSTAIAFMKELLQKYISYFANKGCSIFNIGADEYANDNYSSGSMGFGHLLSSGKYPLFVDYVNELNTIIKAAGMKTMAFNDGIYFQNNTSYAFDKDILISFWSSGWGSGSTAYKSASASTMAGLGHPMYNTNGDYYYILGVNDTFTPGTGTTHADGYHTAAEGFSNTAFMGSTVSDPAGSVFCVWADLPGAETETEVAKYIRPIMRVIAARMQDSNDYEVDSIVAGGFNADGTINVVEPEEPDVPVTPEEPENVTLTDNSVSVTAPGLESIVVKVNDAVVTEEKVSKTYSITLNDGNYTDAATVKIPYDSAFDGCNKFVGRVGEDEFKVTKDGDCFICEVPHFSDVEIEGYAVEEDIVSKTSGTGESYVLDTDSLNSGAQYMIVYQEKADSTTGKALTANISAADVTINGTEAFVDSPNVLWTYTVSDASVYLNVGNAYLYPQSSSLSTTTSKVALTLTKNTSIDGAYQIKRSGSNRYVSYTDGWTGTSYSSNSSYVYFYLYTPSTEIWTITPNASESAIALLTVVNDNFTDASWTVYESALKAANEKLAEVKNAKYSSESEANSAKAELTTVVENLNVAKNALEKAVSLTINYVASGKTVKTETKKVSGNATSITLTSPITGDDGNSYEFSSTTLDLTTGITTFTVTVSLHVDPLVIETWITNKALNTAGTIEGTSTNILSESYKYYYKEISASTSGISSETGVLISSLVENMYTSSENITYKYWRSRYLTTEKQDNASGNNKTTAGDSVVRVRYWDNTWSYQNDAGVWTAAGSIVGAKVPQIVAFYIEKRTITTEVTTYTVDFGEAYGNWYTGDGTGSSNKYVLVDYAVKYESGERNPNAFPITNITQKFHCNPTQNDIKNGHVVLDEDTNKYYRNLWGITVENTGEYEVYMITITPTSDNASVLLSAGANSETTGQTDFYSGTERVIWVDDESNLGDFADAVNENSDLRYTSISGDVTYTVGGTPTISELEIYNRHGMLITYYVRAKTVTDALTVHYIDDSEGANNLEFYTYNIIVKENTIFDAGIKLDPNEWKGNLVNGTVTNSLGKPQTVSADLSTLSQIGAQYLYSQYVCNSVVRSDDGKEVFLHYTFNPTVYLVADFGLPMEIKASTLNKNLAENNIKDMQFSGVTVYGKLTDNGTYVTYTPTKILQGLDYFTLLVTTNNAVDGILDDAANTIAFRVYIVPATTVYYEESFLTYDSSWSNRTAPTKTQTTSVLGSSGNYGYDEAYTKTEDAAGSNGKNATASTAGATASFTFTGTGFELYGNSNGSTGIVSVLSQANADNAEKVNKIYMIDTKLSGTPDSSTTGNQYTDAANQSTYYSLPFISEKALPYGTYTVTIKRSASNETNNPIQIDGVRIINTIKDSSIYVDDLEDEPSFYQLRDMVLTAVGVSGATSEQVYKAITTNNTETVSAEPVAVVMDGNSANSEKVQDLLDNGPKNELYLYPGQTLTFNVETARVMQLGLKSPTGSAEFEITVNGNHVTLTSLSTSVDMFYKIAEKATASTKYAVIVKVNSGLLSVTDLKICDDPNAAFVPLTQADIENVLSSIAGVPEEPVITYADAELNVRFVDYTGRVISSGSLTANGVTGTDMTFSASDILGAASMPARYAFVDADSVTDAIVACGESETVTVQIGRVATLRVVYMNLFGRKLDTVVITRVQTKAGYAVIPASEIRSQAPAGARVIWPIPTYVSYGSSVIVTVPVI